MNEVRQMRSKAYRLRGVAYGAAYATSAVDYIITYSVRSLTF